MPILITGVAGFIGMHCAMKMLEAGELVVGVDNLNDYYDVSLKKARLEKLRERGNFEFVFGDIAENDLISGVLKRFPQIDRVLHLAAQAGVRYSITNPHAYVDANVKGHLSILEACRHSHNVGHLVYASSSSVYGANSKVPFSTDDRVDSPISLYAATKRAGEMMSWCYSHLYKIPQTGLRFFSVYGPWGRPDMAAFIFTKGILEGTPIKLYNFGEMRRDFTYIDDIVDGIASAIARPPIQSSAGPAHRIYNLGNSVSEDLKDFVAILERVTGRTARICLEPMQPGDVKETFADIASSTRDLSFSPRTTIAEGLPRFVEWYRDFYSV